MIYRVTYYSELESCHNDHVAMTKDFTDPIRAAIDGEEWCKDCAGYPCAGWFTITEIQEDEQ
ncbi:MAG: hypothetical protein IJY50_03655 [Clostridia bacterium]|nr:hypothetical protein [Clostridia bacterium]